MSVQRNLIKMPHYQSMAFGQKLNFLIFGKKMIPAKGHLKRGRMAKFQLYSIFHFGAKGPPKMT